ncbi:MAG: hypothetical protein P8P74_14375 [Crocinitomicaceae bacterium]|nr:hypothetical protein [Crocinitomicaceae bacterium]
MKYWIVIYMAISPLFGITQQRDSLVYCEYPDTEAQPPYRINKLLNIVLDNHQVDTSDCIRVDSRFYYNIIILGDGSVSLLNLECVNDNQSCFISVDDPSKLEKWKPATKNGENCNQKMRIHVYIHLN